MKAWYTCTGLDLIDADTANIVGRLQSAQSLRGFTGSPAQHIAWEYQVNALRDALKQVRGESWTVALEYELLRLEKRIDAVLLTDRAIVTLEFKASHPTVALKAETEDYALDLRDFHEGCRCHSLIPVLVAADVAFVPPANTWSRRPDLTDVLVCGHSSLGDLLTYVQLNGPPADTPLRGTAWLSARYRPVPTIIEAATMLYARNSVAEIAATRADALNLTRTTEAIWRAVHAAKEKGDKRVVFITGEPGAGKTLCGLNVAFSPQEGERSAFLTGNVPLVDVLREALARDAISSRQQRAADARRHVRSKLQNVHRFLDDNAKESPTHPPNDRLVIFDEAQRAWNEDKARRGTLNKPSTLTRSEPWHTLEIMGRHDGWAVIVALIGNGQEINTGEAGLREWGRVIESSNGKWLAVAARRTLDDKEPMQRLSDSRPQWLELDEDCDLRVPIRNIAAPTAAGWVKEVLDGNAEAARAIANNVAALPFFLTRDMAAMREALRRSCRGRRRAGLVASAGAKRLIGEGLGAQLTCGTDWFLNRWPDPRASDALETYATEYDCQGLELDSVGLAWGGDFIHSVSGWRAREFRAPRWNEVRSTIDYQYTRNSYRVLLTRARYETIIWVPPGTRLDGPWYDATRDAGEMNAVADFLCECGVRPLPEMIA